MRQVLCRETSQEDRTGGWYRLEAEKQAPPFVIACSARLNGRRPGDEAAARPGCPRLSDLDRRTYLLPMDGLPVASVKEGCEPSEQVFNHCFDYKDHE